ncbi:hypothetical protein GBAR_LOCUS19484 [Geodia barretti]|uniref:Uncharacterized protein n=1 Tax=Geodia barretti TaxID=519541 RepID=A0AA35SS31_GEOBA|nr:hypothetical protein GBAR_LOCUS19484 [Geodia barretti]
MVRDLVQANADVNQMEQGGLSPLMMCCEQGDSEMAKLLLDSQANPNLQQSEYRIHSSDVCLQGRSSGHSEGPHEHGADPLIRNSAGVTALGVASANKFPDVCNELNHWGQPDSTTDVEHPETSSQRKEEVDEVVSRFRGQMLEEAPYDNRERGRGGGKKFQKNYNDT